MNTRKTLIASAVLLGLSVMGQAMAAENTENGPGQNTQTATEDNSTHSGDNRDNRGRAAAEGYGTACLLYTSRCV